MIQKIMDLLNHSLIRKIVNKLPLEDKLNFKLTCRKFNKITDLDIDKQLSEIFNSYDFDDYLLGHKIVCNGDSLHDRPDIHVRPSIHDRSDIYVKFDNFDFSLVPEIPDLLKKIIRGEEVEIDNYHLKYVTNHKMTIFCKFNGKLRRIVIAIK